MEDRLTVVPTEVGRQVTILILTVDPQAAVMATIPMAMARVTATDIPMAPTHTIRILTERAMELISMVEITATQRRFLPERKMFLAR